MSRAFVKDGDDQWLTDVSPSVNALIVFLTRENNGIPVSQKREYMDKDGSLIHVMSNGFSYSKDREGRWQIVEQ